MNNIASQLKQLASRIRAIIDTALNNWNHYNEKIKLFRSMDQDDKNARANYSAITREIVGIEPLHTEIMDTLLPMMEPYNYNSNPNVPNVARYTTDKLIEIKNTLQTLLNQPRLQLLPLNPIEKINRNGGKKKRRTRYIKTGRKNRRFKRKESRKKRKKRKTKRKKRKTKRKKRKTRRKR